MKKLIQTILNHSYLPSWMILFCDLIIYASTFIITYWLVNSLTATLFDNQIIILQMMSGIPFFYLAYYFLLPHRGIIRHSTTRDAIVLIFAHLAVSSGLMFISFIGHIFIQELAIPYSIIFIHLERCSSVLPRWHKCYCGQT